MEMNAGFDNIWINACKMKELEYGNNTVRSLACGIVPGFCKSNHNWFNQFKRRKTFKIWVYCFNTDYTVYVWHIQYMHAYVGKIIATKIYMSIWIHKWTCTYIRTQKFKDSVQ